MARLHRVSIYSSILISIYLLALFEILPIPPIDASVAQEILPVVRPSRELTDTNALAHAPIN
jgi:dolichyl-phosphate mannosyltransferase polypeptide 3